MIYIFEDRIPRKEANVDIVNKYKEHVTFANFDIQGDEKLGDYVIEKFANADCIIFHKSYTVQGVTANLQSIKEFFSENQIKFVTFSGGIESGRSDSSGFYATVNANTMYENLEEFLKNFVQTKEAVLDILVWGKDFKKNKIIALQYEILTDMDFPIKFIMDSPEKVISSDDIEECMRIINNRYRKAGFHLADLLKQSISQYEDKSLTISSFRNIFQIVIDKLLLS